MSFTFPGGSRCFVGAQIRDGTCTWQEWNTIAFDAFLVRIAELQSAGLVQVQVCEQGMLVTQPNPKRFHLKAFLTQATLLAYVLENLWDRDFIKVAASEMLPHDIEFKEAA
ncbi:MAG: hypothetical protein Athens041674_182 [Parcubacteria group bacterium Athens0416_74]|nr:MAG: hypothetical protein Athens041674_182 [Parcubacteria group bacterium Athens0416_74]